MAKYPYIVNKNGVWYQVGEEVPDIDTSKDSEEVKAVEKPQPFTKTEINRMSTEDLRKFATEQGIENAEKTSGAELKKLLIEKFGL